MPQGLRDRLAEFKQRVESCAAPAQVAGHASRAQWIKELMAKYVSLLQQIDEAVTTESPRDRWNQAAVDAWIPSYKQHAELGARIRDMKPMREFGLSVSEVDAFMRAFVSARMCADAIQNTAIIKGIETGTVKLRRLEEPRDELSDRHDQRGRSGPRVA